MGRYFSNESFLYTKETFLDLDESVRKEKDFVIKCLKKNGLLYEFLDESLKMDKEVLLTAFQQDEVVWKFINPVLYDDINLMMELVKLQPFVLNNFPFKLRINKNFVATAIEEIGVDALWNMPLKIFQDIDLIVKALQSKYGSDSWEPILCAAGDKAEYSKKSLRQDSVFMEMMYLNWILKN